VNPGNAHSPPAQLTLAAWSFTDHNAHHLVTWGHGEFGWWCATLNLVKLRVTDAASVNPYQHFGAGGLRSSDVLGPQWLPRAVYSTQFVNAHGPHPGRHNRVTISRPGAHG